MPFIGGTVDWRPLMPTLPTWRSVLFSFFFLLKYRFFFLRTSRHLYLFSSSVRFRRGPAFDLWGTEFDWDLWIFRPSSSLSLSLSLFPSFHQNYPTGWKWFDQMWTFGVCFLRWSSTNRNGIGFAWGVAMRWRNHSADGGILGGLWQDFFGDRGSQPVDE